MRTSTLARPTRAEAKQETRRRLLEAAARVLGETGYGGLSASAVTRAAGVAQPTFYLHFRDKDELIRTLADAHIGELRAQLRAARAEVRGGRGVAAIRETFRVALDSFVEHPGLVRLYAQERSQPASPFGDQSRRLAAELRHDLAEDLAGLGLPAATREERERLQMIAEGMIAQTEALGLAYTEGRYTSLDAVVDVLTAFAAGVLGVQEEPEKAPH